MTFLRPSGPGPSLPMEMELALAPFLYQRDVSFGAMAQHLARRFGPDSPRAGEVAAFFGWRYAGHPLIRQIARDEELATFLRDKAAEVALTELRREAIARFGRWRVPSRTVIHRFLVLKAGWSGQDRSERRDKRILDLVRAKGEGLTLSGLVRLCRDHLGAEEAPSRTRLALLLRKHGVATAGRPSRAKRDKEVGAWIGWASNVMPLPRLHAEGVKLFGARMPSRSATARHRATLDGRRPRRAKIGWDRELEDFIKERAGWVRPAAILRDIKASFPPERWPSRSALHRILPDMVARWLKNGGK